ncbi:MAG: 3-[(3aS,4S,7aS)-7a-methyl-1,5-dioxo-octahydro-1H-inden-4-yl]propanoyl:CoA ligase [Luteibacter sp.]|uniref:AMP-binding protein n=1 Tax=Luteibacter sp. TaxID=1886636 RepID=UPI00137F4F07|nr:AMP-binding protein [Luteibacter sp.]KAF1007150.1 MAG: 3-[(3aS,4S,7aS)-7a-methyl-1,5-dioxo-octahydro-1H-inden-4-yl]propanoyl:CoA ligase [Luteibacter sp.]
MPPTPSYVHGASATPLLGETVGELLDRVAARWPDRPALVVRQQGVRWTYRQFHAEVERVAAGLLALGLEPGDRVGIWAPNRAEWVVTQFAAPKAGLVLVNINPAYRSHELTYALNKVGCRALILPRAFKSSHYLEILASVRAELAGLRHVILLDDIAEPGTLRWSDIVADDASRATLAVVEKRLSFDDPANIQFTSGTTGAPKGATLTHHNIVNNGFFIGEAMRLTEVDRLCIPVPFYHCFGMVLGNLACVTHGACMVIPGEGFDPLATLETVAEERCTGLHGVPTMFIAELEHPRFGEFDLSSLRTGIMAGSPCPIEVTRRVVDEMHMAEVTIAYGMTETSPVSFQTVTDDPLELRVSTVGRVHPHVEVKVVDDVGHIVPRGETGELLTRGYSVMRGYWGDELATRTALDAARWMHTGDLATLDEDGYCRIVGRLKDMIIRGGENIYPREIEEFLYGHPDIQEVQVFGVPDPRLGEQVAAWVRLREGATLTEEAIREHCRRQLAYFKVPQHVRFVDAFPMTVTGKVQKYLMREAMIAELAGNATD